MNDNAQGAAFTTIFLSIFVEFVYIIFIEFEVL